MRSRNDAISSVRAPAIDPTMLNHVRALIVDDDEDALELLGVVLESAGASATAAKNAQDALAADGPFDVIISDIGMPRMDGYDFIQRIRSRDAATPVPALALTAFSRPEDAERALRAGYQEHLTKPVDVEELLSAVKRWTQFG
jgi:two-component system CheB/CheR fusion protein